MGNAFEVGHDTSYLAVGEHCGKTLRFFSTDRINRALKFLVEHVTVQENQGAERLILG